eukprot:TRINITY_DN19215_c0_g2_i1.p1 TRINITY_DN19215_c0_g2~~TRINITY_DN19215_c0_g2_i1.p1  ORF type:complete len:152 (+),score=17.11 TRINITY_DN19215_c0_g2_i1:7-462(+)
MRAPLLSVLLVTSILAVNVQFSMWYDGPCGELSNGIVYCWSKVGSQQLKSQMTSDGVAFTITELVGASALIYSQTPDGVTVSGNVTVGSSKNTMTFSGYQYPLGEDLTSGAGNITSGTGQFEGITGIFSFTGRTNPDGVSEEGFFSVLGTM